METLGGGGKAVGKAAAVLGGSRRAQAQLFPDPGRVTHWVTPFWVLQAFLGFSPIPAASLPRCSGFLRRAEHEVTEDQLATESSQPSQCSRSKRRLCGLRPAPAERGSSCSAESHGAGSSGGSGSAAAAAAAAAAAHCLNCPPRVKLFNFSPFARLNPTLREQKPKVGDDQEMGAQ